MITSLVSIIIPLYNAEKFIAGTIQSAINQTWENIEVLVIDDGSTDHSFTIAKQFESEKVKVFSQNNSGASAARNYGLKEAKGVYIQFLDADDLLSPNKIETQVKVLNNNPGWVAVCNTTHFFNGEDPFQNKPSAYESIFLYTTDNPVNFLINLYGGHDNRGSMIQPNAWLTPRNLIDKAGSWSEFYSPDDDGDFFCRVLLASKGICYVENAMNYYRKFRNNTHSLSNSKSKKAIEGLYQSFQGKRTALLKATTDVNAKKAMARHAMDIAVIAYLLNKEVSAKALNDVQDLGGTDYLPVIGGKFTEFVKKIAGWKAAKIFSFYFNILKKWLP